MALTSLDANTALLVVDLQKGIAGAPVHDQFKDVVDRARALSDAFRAAKLPVVLINVAGSPPGRTEQARRPGAAPAAGFTDFIAEVNQQPSDIVVTKRTRGAFASTDLETQLKRGGVTQVVVIGIATASGVEETARQAYEHGFNVTLAIDAMADPRAGAHEHSIQNVFPRIGETGTSQDIIALLSGRRPQT